MDCVHVFITNYKIKHILFTNSKFAIRIEVTVNISNIAENCLQRKWYLFFTLKIHRKYDTFLVVYLPYMLFLNKSNSYIELFTNKVHAT